MVKVLTVSLTAAEIAALNCTPVVAQPAPGPGFYLVAMSPASVSFVPGTIPPRDYSANSGSPSLFQGLNNSGFDLGELFSPGEITGNAEFQAISQMAGFGGDLDNLPLVVQMAQTATGKITKWAVAFGGVGCPVGTTFTVIGGDGAATGVVTADNGAGVATEVNILNPGTQYPVQSALPTSVSLTLNVLQVQSMDLGNGSLKVSVPYLQLPV